MPECFIYSEVSKVLSITFFHAIKIYCSQSQEDSRVLLFAMLVDIAIKHILGAE